LELVEPSTGSVVGRPANLGSFEVQGLRREYAPPQPARRVDTVFGDQVRLLGFDVDESESSLDITFYWQAVSRMSRDYKFFVHLSSAEDGELVAQEDGMPRNWTYPTTWWDAGEVVADCITVDISTLSPGRYDVSVGIYLPETLERLPVVDGGGAPLSERRLILPYTLGKRE
jgi:hypothetical protein